MTTPLQILFPNGQVEAVLNYIWDVNTLQPIVWTGAVTGGGGGGGGAVTIADGADTAEGFIADTAVTGDNSGTVSAKLRGINKILADVWDSVNHRIKVDGSGVTQPISGSVTVSGSVTTTPPANASTNIAQVGGANVSLGQNTGANSIPVVLASNVALPTGANTIGAVNQGLPGTLANSWFAQLSDAANGPVTVKGALSAPVSNDKALVVGLHPFSASPLQSFSNTAIALSSIGATQTFALTTSATGPTDMVTFILTTLGNPFNAIVFEAQTEGGIFRQVPLLIISGPFQGQWVDSSIPLQEQIFYTFNASAIANVRLRMVSYTAGAASGNFTFSPQGIAPSKVNQAFGLVDASPNPVASGMQPLSLTTDSKLRVQMAPEEMVDFFGDMNLFEGIDSMGTPKFSSLTLGEQF